MDKTLRAHADAIVSAAIEAVLPDEAVRRALQDYRPAGGKTVLAAIGKAAWQMAAAAVDALGHVDGGTDGRNICNAGSITASDYLVTDRPPALADPSVRVIRI